MRLPGTKSALFRATSNKAQESQLFSEMGLLEADLTSTRKDLYAANVRTKSLTSVLKDRTGKVQALEDRIASHDELLKVRAPPPLPPPPPSQLSIPAMLIDHVDVLVCGCVVLTEVWTSPAISTAGLSSVRTHASLHFKHLTALDVCLR